MFSARRALLLPWDATTEATMESTLLGEIRRIQRLSVNELQTEWSKLYDGEPCRSRNLPYLVKRLCWRLQELQLGGLSQRARERIEHLCPDMYPRACPPRDFRPSPEALAAKVTEPRRVRDLRLPTGSVITKTYKGRQIRVVVREDSFEFEGRTFESLSVLAKFITGKTTQINGRLFFGLTVRKR